MQHNFETYSDTGREKGWISEKLICERLVLEFAQNTTNSFVLNCKH